MRMEDYQKWLDQQFVDEFSHSPADTPEEPDGMRSSEKHVVSPAPAFLSRDVPQPPPSPVPTPYSAPTDMEPATPQVVYEEPASIPEAPPVSQAAIDEPAIPSLDEYIPFLRTQPEPSESAPAAAAAEHPSRLELPAQVQKAPAVPVAAPAADSDPAVEEPLKRPIDIQPRGAEPQTAAHSVETQGEICAERMPVRYSRQTEAAAPLDPDRLWTLVPRHLHVLLAMDPNEVAQNSYKRQFKESRIELVSRLLDPTLNLEDTARLLNVCPATVRRYTNRGLLTHQRTQGDQRRFKLSDVLAFLEAQSRKEP